MSGHSKWATIRHQKGIKDRQKARVNTQRIREITIATREGDSADPSINARLRVAIQIAKGANIAKDKINRAIEKGSGQAGGNATAVRYEGYAPHGVAVLLEGLTDNTNRTVADIRACFNKYGGNLAKNGSLSHLFVHKATFTLGTLSPEKIESITLSLIEAGVEEIEEHADGIQVIGEAKNFGALQKMLEEADIAVEEAQLQYLPIELLTLSAEAHAKVEKLLEKLEEIDDIEKIYHNLATEPQH